MDALPQINTTELEQRHQGTLTNFKARADKLSKRPLDALTAQLAVELDTDAKVWLAALEKETKPTKEALFNAHRSFTAFCAKMSLSAETARSVCRRVIGAYQLQERQRAEAKRLEAERLAREEAERQHEAEVAARLAEAAQAEASGNTDLAEAILEEAHDAEQAPVIPVAVPEVLPPHMEGTSTSFKKVGTVEDPVKYLCFLLNVACTPQMDARIDLINEAIPSFSKSGINAQLKRGLPLHDHGVKVELEPVTRNLNR